MRSTSANQFAVPITFARLLPIAALIAPISSPLPALATVCTWSSTASTGAWSTTTNWVSGVVPGATSGTTNNDTALFNSGSTTAAIVPDLNRNLKSLTFDTSATPYAIGTTSGNPLLLTSGGSIVIASTISSSHLLETVSAPLVLEGSYSLADNDPTHTDLLDFEGAITSGPSGTQTLTITGNADTEINGAIGGGTGTIALVMNGSSTGRLFLGGNNTFSGGVTISAGTIVLDNPSALGSTAVPVTVASGATLDLGQQFLNVAPPLTIQGTGVSGLGALVTSSFAQYPGAINSNVSNSFSVGGIGSISLSGGFNNVSGSSALTYVGSGVLTLSGTANNSNLSLTVNSGTVRLEKTSSPTVHAVGGGVIINGGLVQLSGTGGDQIADSALVHINGPSATFDTNGQSETIGTLELFGTGINGAGALLNSANATSVLTPSFAELLGDTTIGVTQVAGSLTLNSGISFTGNFSITKVGQGTLILNGNDLSPGTVNVNAGTLMLNGGSVAGDVVNAGTFVYAGTGFGGRLTNTGSATISIDFGPGNGMENDGVVSVAPGLNLAINGAGLLNTGSLSMTGGTLTLSSSGANSNSGSISLTSSARLNLTSASLTNSGMLNLDGTLVNGGGGNLNNGPSGEITGTGTIACSFTNSGLLAVSSGAMNVTQTFTSSGTIQLSAFDSALDGGAVTNTGSIQGLGHVSNSIINSAGGTIEAIGGTLFLGGTLVNQSEATIRAAAGNKILVMQGLPSNAGVVNLVGGTFDNNGHALSNTGQISGFGIFATGGTGLDNNGSITFSGGVTTVNGPVTNEGGRMITVAQNPAIFTGLVTNNMSATFNAVNTTATFAGGFVNNGNSNFVKAGGGTVEIDTAPSLSNRSTLSVTTGTLRFNVVSGAPTIGTGVTAVVSAGAALELAGSVSALANGPNRVNVTNDSNAPGILVSGTNQQVGDIDCSGTTQVNAGSDLTANHIVQSALVIGGTSKNPGTVTIDASDAAGSPLAGLAIAALSPTSGALIVEQGNVANPIGFPVGGGSTFVSPLEFGSSMPIQPTAVPEPASLLMVALGGLALGVTELRRSRPI